MPQMYCSHEAYCTTIRRSNSHHWSSSSQRWNYIYKPYFLDVPTFTISRLLEILAAKGGTNVGEKWPIDFAWNVRLPRNIQGSFTCSKSTTVNLRHGTNGFTSLPKEVVLRIFSHWKIRRLRPGLNPRTWVLKASTPPLDHRSRDHEVLLSLWISP
jgi:hypothetical protein